MTDVEIFATGTQAALQTTTPATATSTVVGGTPQASATSTLIVGITSPATTPTATLAVSGTLGTLPTAQPAGHDQQLIHCKMANLYSASHVALI